MSALEGFTARLSALQAKPRTAFHAGARRATQRVNATLARTGSRARVSMHVTSDGKVTFTVPRTHAKLLRSALDAERARMVRELR